VLEEEFLFEVATDKKDAVEESLNPRAAGVVWE
jgi:hypothetical protein